jgi:Tol biopolymer transport system component
VAFIAVYFFRRTHQETSQELFRVGRISKLTTSGKAVDAAISPDSRYVLYVLDDSGRYSIRLRELKTGADVERIENSAAIYSDLSFAPDNNAFYYLRDEKTDVRTLYRAPLMEGAPTKIIDDVDSPAAISPDGSQIEFFRGRPATGDTALYVVAADGSGLRQIAIRPYTRKFVYSGAAWSADGKSIFTGAFDAPEKARLIQVQVSNGKETLPDSGVMGRDCGELASWTADSRGLAYIATQNGTSNISTKRLANGAEKKLTDFGEGNIFSFDVARNGRGLALIRGVSLSDVVLLEGAP